MINMSFRNESRERSIEGYSHAFQTILDSVSKQQLSEEIVFQILT